jgi:hypothetical protein
MHYRKLKNGYEYKIGETFIEIRNKTLKHKKIVDKALIGFRVGERILITPGMIRDFVEIGKVKSPEIYFPSCDCKTKEKELRASPFSAEIHGKLRYKYMCSSCIHDSFMAI